MRTSFIETLFELGGENPNLVLVTADLGFGVVDAFAKTYPRQFLNVGVAEQNMAGIAAGLALSGRTAFTYSIANFPTLRCLEQIRNDICYHKANVKIVSVGGGYAYGSLGMTHHATEDLAIMSALPGLVVIAPGSPLEVRAATRAIAEFSGPCYMRLGRAGERAVDQQPFEFEIGKANRLRDGSDLTLISTGGMLATCVDASEMLRVEGISARVLSMHTLKPFDAAAIEDAVSATGAIITVEEHSRIGGLGSATAEVLAELPRCRFRRLSLPDAFCTAVGDQQYLLAHSGLTTKDIVRHANELLRSRSPGAAKTRRCDVIDKPVDANTRPPPAPSRQFRVPFVNPIRHYQRLKKEIDHAIFDCLENGDLIHRRQLFDFEKHLAEYVGTKFAVGLNSGYHALHFALLANNIGPGDEVITVAHTFAASVSAIVNCGATPVLVDVGPDYNMDTGALERAVTGRTRAIMPVHLNGRVCDMDPILAFVRTHKLALVEDACQALGASYGGKRAGSFGAGCFSFYPFKALGGFGDGGAITTDDPDLAKFATRMRYNGEDRETGEFHYHGHTALLDNVQAAVLDVKLTHFPVWIEHRRRIANLYRERLAALSEISLPHFPGDRFFDSYQNYVIRANDRDALRAHLTREGIETLVSWPTPLWHHVGLKLGNPSLPLTERLCREVLSLPMSAETEDADVEITAAAIRRFYRHG